MGFALIAPLLPRAHFSGSGYYATAEPAPVALASDWLKARGVAADHLRYLEITGDEGAAACRPARWSSSMPAKPRRSQACSLQ
ncbi:hypothetical protein [Devosia lacusdianchii]|uniref:hypothetical protein n=1 Tax=Devosia lacusdianchii TaxID=2917991 RepID=UPI001F062DD4|nr:hypothetical protein [Devosia sp. JXJ CY 41]